MSRISKLTPETMSPEQKAVHDNIAAGPRGSVRGPFAPMLHNPVIADQVQKLGAAIRYNGVLGGNLREIAILVTGRFWTAQYEWYAHAKIARDLGVSDSIIDAIAQRRRPNFVKTDEAAVYEFATELHEKQKVSDNTYEWVTEQLGEDGVVELTVICGYYGIISMVLNTFEVPLPDGESDPLRE
ncbi:MAG: 4-carboxymuconolactone decarboxylase [Alphaproteobacteria bacterium]|jgi:4-carboxymuconolactone decarboxylase